MSKRIVYFDESGNTGQDMLNKDQKVFVLASVNFNDLELKKIENIFGEQQELHFKNLKKSIAGRSKIIKFLNHELISEEHVMFYVAHKELNVCGQITDQLIETVMFHNGFDLNIQGNNILFMNWIFYFGNFFWDKELYDQFTGSFVQMIRVKDQLSIDTFYNTVEKLLDSVEEKTVLEPVIESRKYIEEILESADKYTIDVTFSAFLVLCDRWYKLYGTPLDVKLDTSKQIDHYADYLEHTRKIAAASANKVEIGYDERTLTFPPQITKLEMVDSKHEFGVQCADLIASSLTFMYNNPTGKFAPFAREIMESKLLQLSNAHVLWPSDNESLAALSKRDAEGINPNDFLADLFS